MKHTVTDNDRDKAYDSLRNHLKAEGFTELPTDDQIHGHFHLMRMEKGEAFLEQGNVETRLAFVVQGCFRYYYLTPSGDDITKHFAIENDFMSSYASLLYDRPSAYGIMAEEDSLLLILDGKVYKALVEAGGIWERMARHYTEHIYNLKELREASLLLYDAKTRYTDFCKRYPKIVGRVKQKHIATFLGIHPVTLSRLQKPIKDK